MSKAQHTPGPWGYFQTEAGFFDIGPLQDGKLGQFMQSMITVHNNPHIENCNHYADARLVSAAPELLEALEHLCIAIVNRSAAIATGTQVDVYDAICWKAFDRAKICIAKAKGE